MPTENGYTAFLCELPRDWQTAQISTIAKIVGGGTPSRDVPAFWRGDVPWATPSEVSGQGSVYLSETRESISTAGLAGSGATLLPAGSLMITTRATLGARAINVVPMTTNQGFKSLVFKSASDAPFFYYLADKLGPELKRRASGTTFLEVSGTELAKIEVPVPPVQERRLIAEILDTLDTTIRQTEAIIEKLKQVKRGLLHDLLTRGIDGNGELRPPQSQAPHLYKPSPLGWIPRGWEHAPVGATAEVIYGISDAIEMGLEGGIKTITLPCVSASGDLNLAPTNVVFTALRKVPESLLLRRGDLLFNWRNGSLNHLGKTAFFDVDGEYTHVGFLLRVRARAEVCLPTFLCAALRYAKETGVFLRAKGQVNNTFNSDELRSLHLAFPEIEEQSHICAHLDAMEHLATIERAKLHKLLVEKLGLMDDLLTGRVRVTPLLA